MSTPETWERDVYDWTSPGYPRTARRTITPTERGTIELTRAEFDGLMKLAGYKKLEP